MRALVIERPGSARVEEVEPPQLGSDEVLVRVAAAGICGSDLEVLEGTRPAPYVRYPVIPGHEWAGTVAARGSGVSGLEPGDPVVAEGFRSCGRCSRCVEGLTNPFASASASSRSAAGMSAATGPKISSRATALSIGTAASTVGSTYRIDSERERLFDDRLRHDDHGAGRSGGQRGQRIRVEVVPVPSRGWRLDVHGLPLGQELPRGFSLLARTARTLLHPAERHVELEPRGLLIHFHDSGADLAREAQCLPEIAREERRRQPERRIG